MQVRQSTIPLRVLFGAAWVFSATTGIVPLPLGTGAAWAQEDGGHDDGDHEDGGHEGGGHEGGGGQHGRPVPAEGALPPDMGNGDSAVVAAGRRPSASGTYVRVELGAALGSAADASWLPPGAPADPQVFFDLDLDTAAMGAIARGRSFGNGWRAEAALNIFGTSDFSGPWSFTVPATPGPHANVEGSVRAVALMANGYYDFATGGRATPFLTAGLGVARNTMSDWTRINPDAGRTRRSFAGNSETGLAWSVGAGVSWDVGPVVGSAPAKLEVSWRYFDLGSVSGGTTPLPGSGAGGEPVEALNFNLADQVISIGLRIPL